MAVASKITLVTTGLQPFISGDELENIQPAVTAAHNLLTNKTGPGSEFLGWLDLPDTGKAQVASIKKAAESIKTKSQVLVVIGIGGSYLGARAAIEALGNSFHNLKNDSIKVFFAGHNLSSKYHADLIEVLQDMDFSINVISKSGTTIEPAIAFRLFKNLLEQKYGKVEARKRIYATTDANKGALKVLADQEGYTTFDIPDDIGGRYSVLTAVGLLPMAVAGIDIEKVLDGAIMAKEQLNNPDITQNPCYQYAAIRNILRRQGKTVELLASYEPHLQSFGEWWKQLFGESEGKDGKGIFPATAIFSTDLHSLGQFIQDGSNIIFETILKVDKSIHQLLIPEDQKNIEHLNYLAGKSLDFINDCAFRGTLQAHIQGQVPNTVILLPDFNEHTLGYLFYYMEKACAISSYILGVNPFNQPGVEAYKLKMFNLLGKEIT